MILIASIIDPIPCPTTRNNSGAYSNHLLNARYNSMPLLKFYKSYISVDEFPTLKKYARLYASACVWYNVLLLTVLFKLAQLQKIDYVPDLPKRTYKSSYE